MDAQPVPNANSVRVTTQPIIPPCNPLHFSKKCVNTVKEYFITYYLDYYGDHVLRNFDGGFESGTQ